MPILVGVLVAAAGPVSIATIRTTSYSTLGSQARAMGVCLGVGALVAAALVVWFTRASRRGLFVAPAIPTAPYRSRPGEALERTLQAATPAPQAAGGLAFETSLGGTPTSMRLGPRVFLFCLLCASVTATCWCSWFAWNERGASPRHLDCEVSHIGPIQSAQGGSYADVRFSCPLPDGTTLADEAPANVPDDIESLDSRGATVSIEAMQGAHGLWYMKVGQSLPGVLVSDAKKKRSLESVLHGSPSAKLIPLTPEQRQDMDKVFERAREQRDRQGTAR